MEYIDRLGKLGYIQHAPFTQDMDANLPNPSAYLTHGLPVRRVESSLNKAQLETSRTPSFCRKCSKIIQAGANEFQRLHGNEYISLLINRSTSDGEIDPAWFGLIDFKVLLLKNPGGAPQPSSPRPRATGGIRSDSAADLRQSRDSPL
jgi:hypothetical protein